MAIGADMQTDFNSLVNQHGAIAYIQLKSRTIGSDYDNATFSDSGSKITGSVFVLPVGKDDRQFLEQGVVKQSDLKMFMESGTQITPEADVVLSGTTMAGSYWCVSYTDFSANGTLVYRKAFIRDRRT